MLRRWLSIFTNSFSENGHQPVNNELILRARAGLGEQDDDRRPVGENGEYHGYAADPNA